MNPIHSNRPGNRPGSHPGRPPMPAGRMTLRLIRLAGLTLLLLTAAMGAWGGEGAGLKPRPELLLQPGRLASGALPPEMLLVDLRPIKDYRQGHIPGAVHLPFSELMTRRGELQGMMPPVPRVEAALGRIGISAKSIVVGYDAADGLLAARLFWTLDYLGHDGGRLLDGGWPGWLKERRPVSREIPRAVPALFKARPRPEKIADLHWMLTHLEDPGLAIVDARSSSEYSGFVRYAQRGGHIPGAISLNWKEHLSDNKPGYLRPAAELLQKFEKFGLSKKKDIAVYCQVHMRAAHSYFVLKWLGYPNVRGYDGSWAEWGNRSDTPIESEHNLALPLSTLPPGHSRGGQASPAG